MGSQSVYIAGAFEHPTREAPNRSTAQLHADVARGALDDAGLSADSVGGYATSGAWYEVGDLPPLQMADYLGLDVSYVDTTDAGGSSYVSHVGHAVDAIRAGRCDVVLITLAGRPRSRRDTTSLPTFVMQDSFEEIYGLTTVSAYALAAQRHMAEHGTTREQLAAIRVAASRHAQHNENALYRDPVTVEDVLESRPIASPLHLLDCCVVTDGGGALLLVSEAVHDDLDRECVEVLGFGESIGHQAGGRIDLTRSAARESGRRAYNDANIGPEDVDYASIYDSFTITVLQALEDLGFCKPGEGGTFVAGGALEAPDGDLPFNTDGGGLCSNHPANRGGMTKLIEAVRQLRGDTSPKVQVDADVALAHGTGGRLGTRHGCATAVLGRCR